MELYRKGVRAGNKEYAAVFSKRLLDNGSRLVGGRGALLTATQGWMTALWLGRC